MKKLFLLFFILHVVILFSSTVAHPVYVQIEDSGGNYTLPEDLSFTVQLFTDTGSGYTLAGTLSYPADQPECGYIYANGLMSVNCAGFGSWYYSGEPGHATADKVKFIPDLDYETELGTDVEEVVLTDANSQSVTISYDTDGSLLTGIVVGFNEDIQGKDVTSFNVPVSFEYDSVSGAVEATAISGSRLREGSRDWSNGEITIKQFDITRNSIPGYEDAIDLAFDVNISNDYDGGYPFEIKFEWDSPDPAATDSIEVVYTIDNGNTWNLVPPDDAVSYPPANGDFEIVDFDYDSSVSGDDKKYSVTINFMSSFRHDSDVSFAFNDGNTGSNLLQLQKPINVAAELVSSEVSTETTCTFSWNSVPGADSYKILSCTGTKNGTYSYVKDPDNETQDLEVTTTSANIADFDINSRTIFYKIEAQPPDGSSYTEKSSDIYCIVEYSIKTGRSNNDFIALPFDGLSYTASSLWADITKVGSLAQWNTTGDYWDTSTRIKMPGGIEYWWLNDQTLDANQPILANTGTGNEAMFFSGDIADAKSPSWNLVTGVNYIYIPLDTDLTDVTSLASHIETVATGLNCDEIARLIQSHKKWQYTNSTQSWEFGDTEDELDILYSDDNIRAGQIYRVTMSSE